MTTYSLTHYQFNKPSNNKRTDQNRQFSKRASCILGMLLSLSLLSACKESTSQSVFEGIDKLTDSEALTQSSAPSTAFCQASDMPFTYALCQVSQTQLMKDNSPLSLQLFWQSNPVNAGKAEILYTFEAIRNQLANDNAVTYESLDLKWESKSESDSAQAEKSTVQFAVNAGMYDRNFAPIGYTVIHGEQIMSLNLNNGGGNFHLMPNGVFWWNQSGQVFVTESQALASQLEKQTIKPWYATQSGPMLVIDGKIHPKFQPDSTSKKFRNGVGVCEDNQVKFVNSREPVNFYEFAQLFKTDLGCSNALFLDGGVASAMYAPKIGINDKKNMGVMVGLVEKRVKKD